MKPSITDQQREILSLLAQGHTQTEASETIGVSSRTLRRELNRTVLLLDARNPTQAVAIAAQLGILGDEHIPPPLRAIA